MKPLPGYSAPFAPHGIAEIKGEIAADELELRSRLGFSHVAFVYHKNSVTFKTAFDKLRGQAKVV